MKYYLNAALYRRPKNDQVRAEYPTSASTIMSDVDKEIHKDNLEPFANMVDGQYENAMMEVHSDWSEACSGLISESNTCSNYRKFAQDFPICHMVFAKVVSNRYYCVPLRDGDHVKPMVDDIHRKQRVI